MLQFVVTDAENYISLIKLPEKEFNFKLKNGEGGIEGYCKLSDEEYRVFEGVFNRMLDNQERVNIV